MHNVDGQGLTGGARLVRYLLEACEKRNIPIIYNTKAIELLTNDAGRVIGVRAQGDLHKTDYFAKDGVVIATGGFSANRELLCRYMGGPLSRLVLRGSPYVTGDNLMLPHRSERSLFISTSSTEARSLRKRTLIRTL